MARVPDLDDELDAAWDELHAATPAGWYVGRPGQGHGGQRRSTKAPSPLRLIHKAGCVGSHGVSVLPRPLVGLLPSLR
jgi:hypothetical protein